MKVYSTKEIKEEVDLEDQISLPRKGHKAVTSNILYININFKGICTFTCISICTCLCICTMRAHPLKKKKVSRHPPNKDTLFNTLLSLN